LRSPCIATLTVAIGCGSAPATDAIRPGDGEISASALPGDLVRFVVEVSGTRYTSGTACSSDLTRLTFDVIVE
jgi:hypothetical protein